MHWSFRAIVVAVAIVFATTSITYAGESLLKLPEQTGACNSSELIPIAKSGVSDILDGLGIQAEAKDSFEKIDPQSIICDNKPLNLSWIDNQLVVAGEATDIAHARDSIIISTGLLHISHSSNNVILCASDVDISHDGSRGGRSLVISKGKIKISFATNSLVYALKGVEISHAHNVQAFNTPERKSSFEHINNTVVTPLFPEEEASNTSLQPDTSISGAVPEPLSTRATPRQDTSIKPGLPSPNTIERHHAKEHKRNNTPVFLLVIVILGFLVACLTWMLVRRQGRSRGPEPIPTAHLKMDIKEQLPIVYNDTEVPITKCPRCGYERSNNDDKFVSSEECPKCGILYRKCNVSLVSRNAEPIIENNVAVIVTKEKRPTVFNATLKLVSYLCLFCFIMLLGLPFIGMLISAALGHSSFQISNSLFGLYILAFFLLPLAALLGLIFGITAIFKKIRATISPNKEDHRKSPNGMLHDKGKMGKEWLIILLCFVPLLLVMMFYSILTNWGP